MKRSLKIAGIMLLAPVVLAACGDKPYISEPAVLPSGASIQTAVTGGGMRGTEETLVEVNTPAGQSHMVRSGYGLGRELTLATVPGVLNTVTGGVVAGVLQKPGCGDKCGPTINVQGGQAVAMSDADSGSNTETSVNVGIAACPNPVGGTCPVVPH